MMWKIIHSFSEKRHIEVLSGYRHHSSRHWEASLLLGGFLLGKGFSVRNFFFRETAPVARCTDAGVCRLMLMLDLHVVRCIGAC